MASEMPEIDEAAAVIRARFLAAQEGEMDRNLARAALAWKELADEHSEICIIDLAAQTSRAEKLEAELRSVEAQVGDYARRATNDEQALLARAKAAEAEVKRLEDLVSEGHSLFVDHTLCCGNEAQHKEARRVANARQLAQSEKAR